MPPPNVLLITSAGWRDECLHWETPRGPLSPNLRALAHQSARASVVDPAPAIETLGEALVPAFESAGYRTVIIPGPADARPNHPDLDRHRAWLAHENIADRNAAWHGDYAAAPIEVRQALGAVRAALPERAHITTWTGLQAVRALQQSEPPFFLWTHFTRPAFPFDPPSPWDELVPRNALALPSCVLPGQVSPEAATNDHGNTLADVPRTEPRLRRLWSHYLGSAALIDHQIGRILSTLTARAISNTAIVFAATSHTLLGENGQITAWGSGAPSETQPLPLLAAGPTRVRFEGAPALTWSGVAERVVALTTRP